MAKNSYYIQHIVEHIIFMYGFRVTSECIPQNRYEQIKLKFYRFIKKRSEKIFNYLNDRYPIKSIPNLGFDTFTTVDGRSRSIWFRKTINTTNFDDAGWQITKFPFEYFEVEIRSIPPEPTIYMDPKKLFTPKPTNNFSINVYYSKTDQFFKFPINSETGIQSIDAYFSDYADLKQSIRDVKLKNIGI